MVRVVILSLALELGSILSKAFLAVKVLIYEPLRGPLKAFKRKSRWIVKGIVHDLDNKLKASKNAS